MDDILKSLARRILALDEDEITRLIPKYRKRMDNFTPTQEWEESVIIYFIINGYRVKSAQFSEELAGYMRRKNHESEPLWAPKIRPDIRQVLTDLSGQNPEPGDQASLDSPRSPEPQTERPLLRLVGSALTGAPPTSPDSLGSDQPPAVDPQGVDPEKDN
jgi:hypothetical protein